MKQILILMLILTSFLIGQSRTMKEATNSSTTALDSAATFTGDAFDVIRGGKWSSLVLDVFVDHDTNFAGSVVTGMDNNTLTVYFGQDGTNWDESVSYTILDSTAYNFVLPFHHQWYYATFANDTVATSTFRLEAIVYENDMSVGDALTTTGSANPKGNASSGGGNNTITTVEVLASSQTVKETTITNYTNGSILYYGHDNTVNATNGQPLFYLDSKTFTKDNLEDIWLISSSSTDCRFDWEN